MQNCSASNQIHFSLSFSDGSNIINVKQQLNQVSVQYSNNPQETTTDLGCGSQYIALTYSSVTGYMFLFAYNTINKNLTNLGYIPNNKGNAPYFFQTGNNYIQKF